MNKAYEIDKLVCEENVPSGFNIYKWSRKHPETAISHSIKRLEKIFDNNDELLFGFSTGKDSTLSASMAILELKRRWARVKAGISRDGSDNIDPLDQKWVGKKLMGNSMDCEWIWSNAIEYAERFIQEHGPGVYELAGKRFGGNDLHITSNQEVLSTRDIYNRIQEGEEFEIKTHL